MKALILLNRSAGGIPVSPEELEALFRSRGIQAEAHWLDADSAGQALKPAALKEVDLVVAAGGDGTVSGLAGRLAGTRTPLGVLPVGRLNHFAKDLGIPLELEKAIDCVAEGNVSRVDVGEVNGHVFVNNSSLGAYPRIVEERDLERQQRGRGKWHATLLSTWEMLRSCPLLRAQLQIDHNVFLRTTPFVFVGNNRYNMDLLSIGARKSLEEGILSVYTAHCASLWGLARLAGHAVLNRLDQDSDFDALLGTDLKLQLQGTDRALVALDGEVRWMRLPLSYRVRTAALRAITPA